MGCCASRKPFLDEENLLQLAEKQLGLYVNSPSDVSAVFDQCSPFLSQTDFDAVAVRLHLSVAVLRDKSSPSYRLFRSLCESSRYNAHKLRLLCILLSAGSARDKAVAYFSAIDTGSSGAVDKVTVRQFLETLTELLACSLPLLLRDMDGRIRSVVEYERKLRSGRAQAIMRLEAEIMRRSEAVSQGEFVERLTNGEMDVLAESRRLRALILYGREGLCLAF